MVEFLASYLMFFLKVATFSGLFIMTVLVVIVVIAKYRPSEGMLVIEALHTRQKELKKELEEEILPPDVFKAQQKALKKKEKAEAKRHKEGKLSNKPRLFVLNFEGDMQASNLDKLKEEIAAIFLVGRPHDEVLISLESGGGYVHAYGLGAALLERLRHSFKLTVAIDKIGASGGYLMAACAHQILAAPYAIIGSIGVIGQIPNFNKVLKKHDVEMEQHTSGEYKRTLTMFGENTEAGRQKFKEDLEKIHGHFKDSISKYRPALSLPVVATGETWLGTDALTLGLVDKIQTSDAYVQEFLLKGEAFSLKQEFPKKLSDKLKESFMGHVKTIWQNGLKKLGITW